MLKSTRATFGALAVLAATGFAMQPAAAKDFYAGKQITITIGFGFGGTYGKYSRMFAEHLGKYIAGNPSIIVSSKPGAGGIKAMNYAANVMPKDGLNMFVPLDSGVLAQLLFGNKVKYDMSKFLSLGSANQTNVIVVVRTDTGIKKWQDLKTKQVVMGSTGRGSTGYLIPFAVNGMLGTKMKIISGYKGSSKTGLAVEQGEVNGAAFNWLFWKSKYERWFKGDKPYARAVLQVGHFTDPDLPKVPMLGDLVPASQKAVVGLLNAGGLVGRGLAFPAGVDKARVTEVRAAFAKMLKDPKFLADAKKRKLRVIASSGDTVQKAINDTLKNATPEVVAQARKTILGK